MTVKTKEIYQELVVENSCSIEIKKLTNWHQITFASILCLRNVLFSILHHSTTSLQSVIWMSKESGTDATIFRILRTVLAVLALGIVAKKSPLLFSNVNTSPNCFDSVCILASLSKVIEMSGKNEDKDLESQRILKFQIVHIKFYEHSLQQSWRDTEVVLQ